MIIHYTKQNPRHGKEGEETGRKRERNPPLLKVPPPESKDMRKERKRKPKGKRGREREREKKKGLMREKNNKRLLTNERKKIL